MNDLFWAIAGAVIGIVLQYCISVIVKIVRQNVEVADNNHIVVSGEWYAAWQTSVEHLELVNTEKILMSQKGNKVYVKNLNKSEENPQGGYLWHSDMIFYNGKSLMGWYFPLKSEQNTSKGMMFLSYISQKKIFYGKWVGCGYDGDLLEGFVVFSKERPISVDELNKIISHHKDSVRIISFDY